MRSTGLYYKVIAEDVGEYHGHGDFVNPKMSELTFITNVPAVPKKQCNDGQFLSFP